MEEKKISIKYPVITIDREYAAYGRTIAAKLSERIGIPYYDKDFVKKTAEKGGYSEEDIQREGEAMSLISKFFNNFLNNAAAYESSFDGIFHAEKEVILELSTSPCIIVGRCAAHILREAGIPSFNIFLYADKEHKMKRAAELDENAEIKKTEDIEKILEKRERLREIYYKQYTGEEMSDLRNYNICMDTGTIGVDACVDILEKLIVKE